MISSMLIFLSGVHYINISSRSINCEPVLSGTQKAPRAAEVWDPRFTKNLIGDKTRLLSSFAIMSSFKFVEFLKLRGLGAVVPLYISLLKALREPFPSSAPKADKFW